MKLNILFLCNKPPVGIDANTITDHIEAFEQYSKHRIWLCSNLGELPYKITLERFDVIIIHYSLCLLNDYYISAGSKEKIRNFKGLKVVFVQDEYRQINKMNAVLAYLNIDVLYTCFPEDEIESIYSNEILPSVTKFNNLTGYIPERLTQVINQRAIADRPTHLVYRARKLPFWYGELAFEKWDIVEKWKQHAYAAPLVTNLSYLESDRIYGTQWVEFLSSAKATLGVESGASVMDFSGELEKNIDKHQLMHPKDDFFTVQKQYLSGHENLHKLNQISPRCFEAIALKTVLVLYEGEYSNILVPGRHYIALKKDFSNIDEVVQQLQDDQFLQSMADRAFNEIALNEEYGYKVFVQRVDEQIEKEFSRRSMRLVNEPYDELSFKKDKAALYFKNKVKLWGRLCYLKLPKPLQLTLRVAYRQKLNAQQWAEKLPKEVKFVLKIFLRPKSQIIALKNRMK